MKIKLAKVPPPARITFRRRCEPTTFISLRGPSIEEAADFVKTTLRPYLDPFADGNATNVAITQGRRAGESSPEGIFFSFKGMTPSEARGLLQVALVEAEAEQTETA